MEKIRVAVIGYGLAGRVFHAPLIAATEGLELAAIVSSRIAEISAAYPGIAIAPDAQQVFADPTIDLVVIATPNDSHFDLAAQALAAGKHVVVDKPFALTAADARMLIGMARGRLLSVFHNRRWDGDFLTLKRLLADGTLGDVAYMESRFDLYRPQVRDRWREHAGPASGIWYDLGSHLLDQVVLLFGMPRAIKADLDVRRPGSETTDYFHVLLQYKTLRVVLGGDSLAPTGLRFVVHGRRGSFLKYGLDPQQGMLTSGMRPGDPGYGRELEPAKLVSPSGNPRSVEAVPGNYGAYYAGIRDAIRGTAPVPVTAREALAVMTLLEAAEVSARGRCEVALPD